MTDVTCGSVGQGFLVSLRDFRRPAKTCHCLRDVQNIFLPWPFAALSRSFAVSKSFFGYPLPRLMLIHHLSGVEVARQHHSALPGEGLVGAWSWAALPVHLCCARGSHEFISGTQSWLQIMVLKHLGGYPLRSIKW